MITKKSYSIDREASKSSFYNNSGTVLGQIPFSLGKRRIVEAHSQTIDHLVIEGESLQQRLHEKTSLDQTRTQRIYQDLDQISKDLEEASRTCVNDRKIDEQLRGRKQNRKNQFSAIRAKTETLSQRLNQQGRDLQDIFQEREREVDKEKDERQGEWAKLIDEFESQILTLDKHLKVLRSREQPIFEQLQVSIYGLESSMQDKIESETDTRKKQHSTIIRLISESIEHLRLIC